MTETTAQRVQRYLLDGSDEDLKRLLTISDLMAEPTRTACAGPASGPDGR
jgi:hypothetical protein